MAGAIFTLPALYILQAKYPEITTSFFKIFLASALGGVLGILFLIPFRKYFVKDMHGKYPFPEATATTQVLVSGAKGGGQAKPLLIAGLIGGLYDFIVATLGWWNENVTSRMLGWGVALADKAKVVFKVNTGAAVLGLGYIVGLKYALYICFGSLFVWWIVVPGMSLLYHDTVLNLWNPAIVQSVGQMSAEEIFKNYARSIGIGGIAMAGIIGIIRSWGIIRDAVGLAGRELKGGANATQQVERTQQDISFKIIAIGTIVVLLATFIFFLTGIMQGNLLFAVVGILLVAAIAFLFTTVAANAIAIVGSNPVSGMTLMTLIFASVIMVAVGLKGAGGMVASLMMGGVVCTALSMAGSFITDLKIGYWLGTTPRKQETWKFLGTLVSAATVGGVMMLLNQTYGFASGNLAAPQANAMAAVIDPLMNGVGAPWVLYGIGALLAIILTLFKVPALAIRTQCAPRCRRFHQLVCHHTLEGCAGKRGARRARNAHSQWLYRRWCVDGCCECAAEVWWRGVVDSQNLVAKSPERALCFGSLPLFNWFLYPTDEEVVLSQQRNDAKGGCSIKRPPLSSLHV